MYVANRLRNLMIASTALLLATSAIAIPHSAASETPDDDAVMSVNPFYAWPFYAWNGPGSDDSDYVLDDYLDLDEVHDYVDGNGVVIATIDTGVDASNTKISGPLDVDGWDFVDLDDDPADDRDGDDDDDDGVADEAHGHGTYVAEVLAHIAPDADLMPVRAVGADGIGSVSAVVAAIDYAIDHGADVITLSLGTDIDEPDLRAAVARAARHDVVVVASAGNTGSDVAQFPAAYDTVIGVSAYDPRHERLADFSTWGQHTDVSALGASVRSPSPRKKITNLAGTSFAAPIVAAQAALLRSANPRWSADQVADQIRLTAQPETGRKRSKHGQVRLAVSLGIGDPLIAGPTDESSEPFCADGEAKMKYDEDDRELEIEIDFDTDGSFDLAGLDAQIGHLVKLPRTLKDDREIDVRWTGDLRLSDLPTRTVLSYDGSPVQVCWRIKS